ncbi:MAG: hypothetical protein NVSMB60_05930 [Mycobacterium sp.]
MISIADFVPSSAIVFSIGHWPTADQAPRSASVPSNTVMEFTLPLSDGRYAPQTTCEAGGMVNATHNQAAERLSARLRSGSRSGDLLDPKLAMPLSHAFPTLNATFKQCQTRCSSNSGMTRLVFAW